MAPTARERDAARDAGRRRHGGHRAARAVLPRAWRRRTASAPTARARSRTCRATCRPSSRCPAICCRSWPAPTTTSAYVYAGGRAGPGRHVRGRPVARPAATSATAAVRHDAARAPARRRPRGRRAASGAVDVRRRPPRRRRPGSRCRECSRGGGRATFVQRVPQARGRRQRAEATQADAGAPPPPQLDGPAHRRSARDAARQPLRRPALGRRRLGRHRQEPGRRVRGAGHARRRLRLAALLLGRRARPTNSPPTSTA